MDRDVENALDPELLPDPTRKYHLDSEYTQHWAEFVLKDGTVKDSRTINWRFVEWEKVHRILVHLKGKVYEIQPHPRQHRFFMFFRKAGSEVRWEDGKPIRHKINWWSVGTTDGTHCFLIDLDFHTGEQIDAYIQPLRELDAHIHPRIKALDKIYKRYVGGAHGPVFA